MTKNDCIKKYLVDNVSIHGIGSVILLPEFVESSEGAGDWTPVVSSGVRATKGENSFIRLGTVELTDKMKLQVRYTNDFAPSGDLELLLQLLKASTGSKLPGKLVIRESVTPFSRTNPARDLKYADRANGIVCSVNGMNIYRITEWVKNTSTEDVLIAHDNGDTISAAAIVRYNTQRGIKPQSANINAAVNAAKDAAAEMFEEETSETAAPF